MNIQIPVSVGNSTKQIWPTMSFLEHPEDVLFAALEMIRRDQDLALVVLTETVGGGVRAPGALMAVSKDGDYAGYLSGGCIDADVIAQSQEALQEGRPRHIIYGAGSPYFDLPLPCGGSISVMVIPRPDRTTLLSIWNHLVTRKAVGVKYHSNGHIALSSPDETAHRKAETDCFTNIYTPKLKLRLAGKGADCIALASAAKTAGFEVHIQSPQRHEIAIAQQLGVNKVDHLTSTRQLPETEDDAFTAFALMFHDVEWESVLLKQALAGDAFYVGAVGSKRTHEKRCLQLEQLGCSLEDIDRIHGPIGAIASLRDASQIAISALAEIIGAYQAIKNSVAFES